MSVQSPYYLTDETSQTLFSIGSCSKAFFATALGLLMDDFAQGVNATALPAGVDAFTWETKVKALLPAEDWELADEWATEKLNLRDALSRVSGLPRYVMPLAMVLCPGLRSSCMQTRPLVQPGGYPAGCCSAIKASETLLGAASTMVVQ